MVDPDVLALYKSEDGYSAIRDWYDALLEQVEVPFESRYIDTRFGKTHALACGPEDAEPLVLVQAVAGSALLWRNQLPVLSEHFRVYALDTVGQPGRSAPNPPSFFENDYMNWLLDIISESGHACIYDQPQRSNDRIMSFLLDGERNPRTPG